MSIKPLPEDVIRRITSSATITSINGVVCGLLKNSFDAGATRINITIDYARGNCTVEDDGLGILPLEFGESGALGKLHHTSRHSPEIECHGANGSFLASLAALSLLSIASHHHLHNSQNTLTIHNSRILARNIPALPEQRLLAFAHGTRVTVRDLFGSMAVRVKQRAAASEKAAVDKEYGHLVRDIAALLLAWPSAVALFVRDTVHNNETSFRPNTSKPNGKHDLLSRSSLVLVQSGLVDGLDHISWIPIGASVGKLTIEGCISLKPVATRRAQFVSLGIHPVANEHRTNVLYSEVNRVFINSGFAIEEDTGVSRESDAMLQDSRQTTDKVYRPKRGLDRWPMFYFRISSSSRVKPLTSSFEDLLEDRNRTLSDMIDLLKLVCYEFLKKHHLRPRRANTSLREPSKQKHKRDGAGLSKEDGRRSRPASLKSSRSNSTTPISRPDSPFDLWQRVKAGRASEGSVKSRVSTSGSSGFNHADQIVSSLEKPPSELNIQPSLRFLDETGNVLRRPFEDLASTSPPKKQKREQDATRRVVSPDTSDKEENSKVETPKSLPAQAWTKSPVSPVNSNQGSGPNDTELASAFQRFKENSGQSTSEPGDWLKGLLQNWENPVFQPAQPSVPRLDDALFDGPSRNTGVSLDAGTSECSHSTHSSTIKLSGRISKTALAGAEVVSQVDQKFILVKLGRDRISGNHRPDLHENSVLVLVDQHAADERCQLEALMQDYFHKLDESNDVIARTELLGKPLQFEFSTKECRLLRRYSHHLRRWGIYYKVEEPESNQWRHKSKQLPKIEVTSLPPSILERCRTEPRVLAELLRNEIWKLEEEGNSASRPSTIANGRPGREVDWVAEFHGCPQGILDLLNSRSCRSAIMFNDILTKEECNALVERLSRCSFPFQCAHGRPSMVPLVDTKGLNMTQEPKLESFAHGLKKSGLIK